MNTSRSLALSIALSAAACGGLNNPSEIPESNNVEEIRQSVANDCNLNLAPIKGHTLGGAEMPFQRPARKTHWEVTSDLTPEITTKIRAGEKLFLIIGNESCSACYAAENWWSVRSAGDFQTYHVSFSDDKENHNEDTKAFFQNLDLEREAIYPFCVLIDEGNIIKREWGAGACMGGDGKSIAAWMNERCIQ